MPLEIGNEIAGYRIDAVVGRGGMGVVYRATEIALDRPVALKLIAPELAGDARFRDRFMRESRLAASIDHAGILPVYAVGEADGELFLAMRFVAGTDLRRVLEERGPLPVDRALDSVGQIAGALDAAHERGLVHRDVKPANVLVDPTGHCYLSDFGLTKQTDSATTASGTLAGTLDYLAPEQIRGDAVGAPADQYALAILLYECLTGAPPFRRASEAQTLFAHVQEPPPRVSAQRPGLPEALDDVLARGLAKEPERRYPTCGSLVEDAQAAAGITSARARPRRSRRRKIQLAIGAALLGLGALVVAAVLVATRGDGVLTATPNSVAAVDPATRRVVAVVPVGSEPTEIVARAGAVWVVNSNEGAGTITRIDAARKVVSGTFAVPGTPRSLGYGGGSLWVGTTEGRVFRVDPDSGATDSSFTLRNAGKNDPFNFDPGAGWLTVGAGAVWATSLRTITRIDLRTSQVRASVTPGYGELAFGFGSLWAIGAIALDRLAPTTMRRIARIGIAVGDLPFDAGEEGVWIGDDTGRAVFRIDPQRNVVARTIDVAGRPFGVAVGAGAVWAAIDDGTIARIDPITNRATTIRVGGRPRNVSVGSGLVWVSVD